MATAVETEGEKSSMDFINVLDRKYSGENAVPCPNEGKEAKLPQSGVVSSIHGSLTVHGSGAYLVCGLCGAQQVIGRV